MPPTGTGNAGAEAIDALCSPTRQRRQRRPSPRRHGGLQLRLPAAARPARSGGTTTANPPPSPNAAGTGSGSGGSSGGSGGATSSSGSSGGGQGDDGGSPGGSSGCSSAASTPGAGTGASGEGGSAPTWTKLWTEYLAAGTVGGCAKAGCHGTPGQCDTPSDCYQWLDSYSDICGGINNNALFSWTPNGFMPAGGPTSEPNVVTDFAAWTAAGSQNN